MRSRLRGSALTEFTFLAPVLLILFLGLVGLGVEVWAQLGLVAVAQEAAHAAAVAPSVTAAVDLAARLARRRAGRRRCRLEGSTR